MATNFRGNIYKLAYSPSFVALAFRKGLDYCTADFKTFICDDLATSRKNLVKFGPATPEFEGRRRKVKPLIDQQFCYVSLASPLLDLVVINTEFFGAISRAYSVLLHYHSLRNVTAMPRGLHARPCHAFLVCLHYFSLFFCWGYIRQIRLAAGQFFSAS